MMKKIVIRLMSVKTVALYALTVLLSAVILGSCESNSEKLLHIELVINSMDFVVNSGEAFMDDNPETFLNSMPQALIRYNCYNADTLVVISKLMKQSVETKDTACVPSFDTDLVAIVQYKTGYKDTIGLSFDEERPLTINNKLYYNRKLSGYLIDLLAVYNQNIKRYLDNSRTESGYKLYGHPVFSADENVCPPDYGFFKGTEAERLARAMQKEDAAECCNAILSCPSAVNDDYKSDEQDEDILPLFSHNHGARLITSCIKFQQEDMLRLLLQYGARLDLQDGWDWDNSPLMTACENSHFLAMGKILIDAGANVNFNNGSSAAATPLMVCVINRNISMAEYLLSLNADKCAENSKGQTAFDLAIQRKYMKMAYLLMIKGYNPQHWTNSKGERIELRNYLKNLELQGAENKLYRDKMLAMIE